MFGLLKKPMNWKDLEFTFVTVCCGFVSRGERLDPAKIEAGVQALVKQVGCKLSPDQENTLALATSPMIFVEKGRPLWDLMSKYNVSPGVLDRSIYQKIISELERCYPMASFKEKSTMADLEKMLRG